MSQTQPNAALDSQGRFALQKGVSVLEVTMETPSHIMRSKVALYLLFMWSM